MVKWRPAEDLVAAAPTTIQSLQTVIMMMMAVSAALSVAAVDAVAAGVAEEEDAEVVTEIVMVIGTKIMTAMTIITTNQMDTVVMAEVDSEEDVEAVVAVVVGIMGIEMTIAMADDEMVNITMTEMTVAKMARRGKKNANSIYHPHQPITKTKFSALASQVALISPSMIIFQLRYLARMFLHPSTLSKTQDFAISL